MLEYKLTVSADELESIQEFTRGPEALEALRDIANIVFRPARKHGYAEAELDGLAEGNEELIGMLEEEFYKVLEDRGISLWA